MSNVVRCPCSGESYADLDYIRCNTCNTVQHRRCMQSAAFMGNYECPSCQLRKANPFFEVVGYFVWPRMVSVGPVEIPKGLDLTNLKVLVRCLKLTEEGYSTECPNSIVKVNNEKVSEGKSDASDITSWIPSNSAPFTVEFIAANAPEFVWAVLIVRRRTVNEVKNLIHQETETKENSLKLIFQNGTRNEVQVETLPMKSSLLPRPVRGFQCTHFKCFDLNQFLEERDRKRIPDCKCQVCGKSCFSVKFDIVQNQLQIQYGSAMLLDLIAGIGANNPTGATEPFPQKKPKLASEPKTLISFEDFLTRIFHIGKIPDEEIYTSEVYSGIETLWKRLNQDPTAPVCICEDEGEIQLEELGFRVERVHSTIDLC